MCHRAICALAGSHHGSLLANHIGTVLQWSQYKASCGSLLAFLARYTFLFQVTPRQPGGKVVALVPPLAPGRGQRQQLLMEIMKDQLTCAVDVKAGGSGSYVHAEALADKVQWQLFEPEFGDIVSFLRTYPSVFTVSQLGSDKEAQIVALATTTPPPVRRRPRSSSASVTGSGSGSGANATSVRRPSFPLVKQKSGPLPISRGRFGVVGGATLAGAAVRGPASERLFTGLGSSVAGAWEEEVDGRLLPHRRSVSLSTGLQLSLFAGDTWARRPGDPGQRSGGAVAVAAAGRPATAATGPVPVPVPVVAGVTPPPAPAPQLDDGRPRRPSFASPFEAALGSDSSGTRGSVATATTVGGTGTSASMPAARYVATGAPVVVFPPHARAALFQQQPQQQPQQPQPTQQGPPRSLSSSSGMSLSLSSRFYHAQAPQPLRRQAASNNLRLSQAELEEDNENEEGDDGVDVAGNAIGPGAMLGGPVYGGQPLGGVTAAGARSNVRRVPPGLGATASHRRAVSWHAGHRSGLGR